MNNSSRRAYLGAVTATCSAVMAGCTGSSTSSSGTESGCSSETVAADDDSTLLRTSVVRDDGMVLLEVSLERQAADKANVETVKVFDSAEQLRHEIPRPRAVNRPEGEDLESYYHAFGAAPRHGHLRVEARSVDGSVADFREFTFICNSDPFE